MDFSRILSKLDHLVETKDYDGAKELLSYWLEDAKENKNLRGELSLYNESMGLYRKLGEKEKAINCAENALSLVGKTDMEGTISAATTDINSGTVYKAFGEAEKGLPLFEKAKEIYEKELPEIDGRLGGLYNNMGLALLDLNRYEDAIASYEKALSVMEKVEHGNLEKAITYLNIADVYDKLRADESVASNRTLEDWESLFGELLDKAECCLEDATLPRNGYYAFVAEKCAPSFGYYGRFLYKMELDKRVKEILETIS